MKKLTCLITLTILAAITYFALPGAAAYTDTAVDFRAAAEMLPSTNTAELFLLCGTVKRTCGNGLRLKLADPEVLSQTIGFLVRYSGSADNKQAFLTTFSAREVYNQIIGAITLIYASSRVIGGSGEFNLHISHPAQIITVGVPIILGSY